MNTDQLIAFDPRTRSLVHDHFAAILALDAQGKIPKNLKFLVEDAKKFRRMTGDLPS